ncbi:MAG TPA: DNA polymerase IV [Candidatus Aminicenantes bacterium]|nr:DNA polymerase IV [Candidatus Aminicenantes bacterium]
MQPFVFHVDIDAFFAAVEVMLRPELRGRPVIVGGMPDERGVVCTASYEARRYGVHSGMSLRMAGRKCPHGVFLRGRHAVYRDISQRFMECLRRYSPRVEPVSVDEAYVDLGGMRYLNPSAADLAGQLKTEVERSIGLKVSAGLGFTRMGAKLATEAAKPGGLMVVLDEREFVSRMSIERVPGIGPQTEMILMGLGVRRVCDLERRYPDLWKRTVGVHLLGGKRFPAARVPASRSFSRETTFPQDIRDAGLLLSHLSYLVQRLSVHLVREEVFAGRIEVKARFDDFSTFTARSALPFPTYSYPDMWKTVLLLWQRLQTRRDRSLRLVGVKVEDISEARDLLPFLDLRGEQLSAGLRRVRDRYGFSAIATGRSMMLQALYPVEREGVILKTASLAK